MGKPFWESPPKGNDRASASARSNVRSIRYEYQSGEPLFIAGANTSALGVPAAGIERRVTTERIGRRSLPYPHDDSLTESTSDLEDVMALEERDAPFAPVVADAVLEEWGGRRLRERGTRSNSSAEAASRIRGIMSIEEVIDRQVGRWIPEGIREERSNRRRRERSENSNTQAEPAPRRRGAMPIEDVVNARRGWASRSSREERTESGSSVRSNTPGESISNIEATASAGDASAIESEPHSNLEERGRSEGSARGNSDSREPTYTMETIMLNGGTAADASESSFNPAEPTNDVEEIMFVGDAQGNPYLGEPISDTELIMSIEGFAADRTDRRIPVGTGGERSGGQRREPRTEPGLRGMEILSAEEFSNPPANSWIPHSYDENRNEIQNPQDSAPSNPPGDSNLNMEATMYIEDATTVEPQSITNSGEPVSDIEEILFIEEDTGNRGDFLNPGGDREERSRSDSNAIRGAPPSTAEENLAIEEITDAPAESSAPEGTPVGTRERRRHESGSGSRPRRIGIMSIEEVVDPLLDSWTPQSYDEGTSETRNPESSSRSNPTGETISTIEAVMPVESVSIRRPVPLWITEGNREEGSMGRRRESSAGSNTNFGTPMSNTERLSIQEVPRDGSESRRIHERNSEGRNVRRRVENNARQNLQAGQLVSTIGTPASTEDASADQAERRRTPQRNREEGSAERRVENSARQSRQPRESTSNTEASNSTSLVERRWAPESNGEERSMRRSYLENSAGLRVLGSRYVTEAGPWSGGAGAEGARNTTRGDHMLTLNEFLRETSTRPGRSGDINIPSNRWRTGSAVPPVSTGVVRTLSQHTPAGQARILRSLATTAGVGTGGSNGDADSAGAPNLVSTSNVTATGSTTRSSQDSFDTLVGQIRRIGELQDFVLSTVDSAAYLLENAPTSTNNQGAEQDRDISAVASSLRVREARLRAMQTRIDMLSSEFVLLRNTRRELRRVETEALATLQNTNDDSAPIVIDWTSSGDRARTNLSNPQSTSARLERGTRGLPEPGEPAARRPEENSTGRLTEAERQRLFRETLMRLQSERLPEGM